MTENKGAGSIVSHLELPVDSYRPSLTQTYRQSFPLWETENIRLVL